MDCLFCDAYFFSLLFFRCLRCFVVFVNVFVILGYWVMVGLSGNCEVCSILEALAVSASMF